MIIYFINHKLILNGNSTSRKTSCLIYDSNFDRKMKGNTRKCVCVHTPQQSLLVLLYGYWAHSCMIHTVCIMSYFVKINLCNWETCNLLSVADHAYTWSRSQICSFVVNHWAFHLICDFPTFHMNTDYRLKFVNYCNHSMFLLSSYSYNPVSVYMFLCLFWPALVLFV